MFVQERHKELMALLGTRGSMTVREIEQALNASSATVRRDLDQLARQGRILRTHGGAMHPTALQGEPIFQQRAKVARAAKQTVANKAASMVKPGQIVYLDAGTTALLTARPLAARSDLTLFTNSVPLLQLARPDGAKIVSIGGELRIPSQALVGSPALAWLERLHFDMAFIGASGLDEEKGASVTSLEEAAVKQAAMARAAQAILICDMSKWNKPAAVTFAPWSDFDDWVSSAKKTDEKKQ